MVEGPGAENDTGDQSRRALQAENRALRREVAALARDVAMLQLILRHEPIGWLLDRAL